MILLAAGPAWALDDRLVVEWILKRPFTMQPRQEVQRLAEEAAKPHEKALLLYYQEEANEAKKALPAEPDSWGEWVAKGLITGDRAAFEKAMALAPHRDPLTMAARASVLPADLAVSTLTLATLREPHRPLWHLLLGDALLKQSNAEKALESFRLAVKYGEDPETVADYAVRHDAWAIARSVLEEVVTQKGVSLVLFRKLEEIYRREGDWAAIEKLFQDAIRRHPKELFFVQRLVTHYDEDMERPDLVTKTLEEAVRRVQDANLWAALADAYLAEKKLDQAKAAYLKAIQIDSNARVAYAGLLRVALDNKNYAGGIRVMEEAVAKNPNFFDAWGWLGFLYMQTERYKEAIPALQRAVEGSPFLWEARGNLGYAHHKLGQDDQAIEILKETVARNPQFLNGWFYLGEIYGKQKRVDEALNAFVQATQAAPYDANAFYYLANAYQEMNKLPEAVEAMTRALLLEPDNLDVRNDLGTLYLKRQLYGEAIRTFNQILERNPQYATAYYNLACTHALTRHKELALQMLERSLLLDPGLREIAVKDADLDSLRNDERFKRLLAQ